MKLLFKKHTSIIIGVILAIFILYQFLSHIDKNVNFEDLALGNENTNIIQKYKGNDIHCMANNINEISKCVNSYKKFENNQSVILWLGNSQLYTINQYRKGDKTASIELHEKFQLDDYYFLTISQPNANLQEHYLLFSYLLDKIPIKNLVLPVVFDDMREEGIRGGLTPLIMETNTIKLLKLSESGESLIVNYSKKDSSGNDMSGIDDTIQKRFEKILNAKLDSIWVLWEKRPSFRGKIMDTLYVFRNWALKINASSTRKIIPGRYSKNLSAFNETIELALNNNIEVLVYIVPLRNDVEIPYDNGEYSKFKKDISKITSMNNQSKLINLENLVPPKFWGTKESTNFEGDQEIDFMHFQSGGHRLLADALYREILNNNNL